MQTRIRTLLGIIIIHLWSGFVNIHFVRFFVGIFGEKYSMKNLSAFVVVVFVYFATMDRVVVERCFSNFDLSGRRVPPAGRFLGKKLRKNLQECFMRVKTDSSYTPRRLCIALWLSCCECICNQHKKNVLVELSTR